MAKAMEQFNPEHEHRWTLEAFTEFVDQFGYQYEALNRDATPDFNSGERH